MCCNDGEHCCPEGYRCDLSAGTCVQGTLTLRWIPTKTRNNHLLNNKIIHTNQHAQNIDTDLTSIDSTVSETVKAGDVHCPGGTTTCPDQYSCCDNGQGGYNCCPMPNVSNTIIATRYKISSSLKSYRKLLVKVMQS